MKSITLSFVVTFLMIFSVNMAVQAQVAPDPRLYDAFGKKYVDELMKSDPSKIDFYNYYLDNSYYTASLNLPKPVTGIDIHTVVLKGDNTKMFSSKDFSKKSFNPLKYDFKTEENNFVTYIWNEAGIAVIFHPMGHIRADYDNWKKSRK